MKYLTHKELRGMMLSSFRRVQEEKEEINKINVFPVPDQDTGTNIAKTIEGIRDAIKDKEFNNLQEISDAILDGALTNAQGNAGVIYTGFLAGFLSEVKEEKMDLKDLASAFEKGAKRAKESIQDPKEGTILDVISATASALEEKVGGGEENIIQSLDYATEKAGEALLETREKMDIFKKANVVDAGGMGFLVVLESFLKSLRGNGEEEEAEVKEKSSQKIKRFIQVISNRFEVVSLIENPKIDQPKIKERLRPLGNCLDLVQIKNKIKIHIHTDYPKEVKKEIRKMGKIQALRVEDMTNEVVGEESVETVSIGLVTDSQALLLPKIKERYQIEEADFHYQEGKKSLEDIYTKETPFPQPAPPSAEEYRQIFKEKLGSFKRVFCITTSSNFSDSFDNAMEGKKKLSDPKRVFVLDSQNLSAGQSLLVLKAVELIQEHHDMKELIKFSRKAIPEIHNYIAVSNIDWLTEGKGISQKHLQWVKRINKVLRFQPLLEVRKNKLKRGGAIFSESPRRALLKRIVDASKKARKEGIKIRIIIGYTNNEEEANQLRKELKEKINKIEVSFIGQTPPSCRALATGNLIAAWTTI